MCDEDAFLAAICAAPDDDTPRLVFADWLQERGHPFDAAWASLIRAQVRLARIDGASEEHRTLLKKAHLIDTPFFRVCWMRRLGLPEYGSMWWGNVWDRGFLNELHGEFTTISDARGSLTHRVPFRLLDIGISNLPQFQQLLEWQELRRLTSLTVYSTEWNSDIGDEYTAELATCPALVGLTALSLRFVTITGRGAADLLDSIHLRGVRELTLSWPEQPGGTLSRSVRKRLRDRFGPHCLR